MSCISRGMSSWNRVEFLSKSPTESHRDYQKLLFKFVIYIYILCSSHLSLTHVATLELFKLSGQLFAGPPGDIVSLDANATGTLLSLQWSPPTHRAVPCDASLAECRQLRARFARAPEATGYEARSATERNERRAEGGRRWDPGL